MNIFDQVLFETGAGILLALACVVYLSYVICKNRSNK